METLTTITPALLPLGLIVACGLLWADMLREFSRGSIHHDWKNH